jgi:hypothetical protein
MSLKSVMAKVAGIEKERIDLASHQVNLGAAEDLFNAKDAMNKMIADVNAELAKLKAADEGITKAKVEADKIVKAAGAAADKVNAASEKLIASTNKTLMKYGNMFDKIDKQAKDLGIDPKQIPNYNEVDKLYFQVDAAVDALNGYTWTNGDV